MLHSVDTADAIAPVFALLTKHKNIGTATKNSHLKRVFAAEINDSLKGSVTVEQNVERLCIKIMKEVFWRRSGQQVIHRNGVLMHS
ncbi:hypothetical protein SAMN05421878_10244 [Actinobaculum suis]|uniref:Uncharacterized protein n=1 Tax=Actinobaculum suis TaxID=1657 RepID=A0A1G7A546_9ACTO|nr:hypothetical protein SAMN05421878_10244 [Actinobaculum suis]